MIIPSYIGTYPNEKYIERRQNNLKILTDNVIETQQFGLNDNYLCTIDLIQTTKQNFLYSCISVFNRKRDLVIKVDRTAFESWICLVDDHPANGKDYFLAGEDTQGYTVYNLTDNTGYCYLPSDVAKGNSFVWHEVVPSPSGLFLAVIGSYFNSDLQLVFYDFSSPESLPLAEINRHHFIEYDEVEGWDGDNSLLLKSYKYFRRSDRKSVNELSNEEKEFLAENPQLVEQVIQVEKYSRTLKENVVD